MRKRLERLFRPQTAYKDPIIAQKAQGLLIFFALAFIALLLVGIGQFIGASSITVPDDTIDLSQLLPLASILFVMLAFFLVHRGFYQAVAVATVFVSFLSLIQPSITDLSGTNILALALPIVAAGMLIGWRAALMSLLAVIALIAEPTLITPNETSNFTTFFVISWILALICFLVVIFGTNIQATATKSLREVSILRQMIANTLEQDVVRDELELVRDVLDMLRDNLGVTFARVFIVENGELRQRIQTGLNRKQMTVDTDFELNSGSGIYEAVRTKRLVQLNNQSPDAMRSHLLQGTRGALAVPINFENDVTAVIDIQSEDLEVFEQADVNVVRFIAQQLGMALGQSKRLEELRKEIGTQETTIVQQREKLLNYERRERQATTQAWVNYLRQRGMDYMGFDISGLDDPNPAVALNDDLQPAIQTGEISLSYENGQQILSVPIVLRGYTLGAMSFRVPEGSQTIGPRQQELIRSVVQRLGLALENKRLFEQSQAQAQRESKANEVGSLLLSSTDIDTVLRMAAESFNQAMGAVQTQIRVRPDSPEVTGSEGAS